MEDLAVAWKRVRLVALDVDGTLTDGGIFYGGDLEFQRFDVRDGYGIAALVRAGLYVAWITGRGSRATERRADELGVHRLLIGVRQKGAALRALQAEWNVPREETLAMGDDLPDLDLFAEAVLCAAPSDGAPEVRAASHFVSRRPGGHGAVRDLAEELLRHRRAWPPATEGTLR